ncbi:MAG TPA: FtsX-like permease family protein [Phnomibacter sp.]|nr:FtsX-like permease family protein [Phnomibacter sp.]
MTTLFAWRYFKAKKTTNAINIISWISVVAIAVVTGALVVVLSVFNGFEDLVKGLYSDFYSDISIVKSKGKWFEADAAFMNRLKEMDGVQLAEPVVEERAILIDGEDKSIVWMKGVKPDYQESSGVPRHIIRGSFETGTKEKPALVVGAGVENALQIAAGESLYPVTTYLPNRLAGNTSDVTEALHSSNLYVTGSFSIQQEFDNQYAFTNIDFMRFMLDLKQAEVNRIELVLSANADAQKVANALRNQLGKEFEVKTRYEQNQSLFVAMQVEKLIIFGVAFLILLIAAFNIMSTLTMMVLEKQLDISVLFAMGLNGARVGQIFLKVGGILAFFGSAIGFVIGLGICLAQQQFHLVKLGGQSFIIDYYPVAIRGTDLLLVGTIVLAITLLAGWLPALRARRMAAIVPRSE